MEWSRQRLAELLQGLAADVDSSIGEAKLTQLKSLTGEVGAGAAGQGPGVLAMPCSDRKGRIAGPRAG